MEPSHSFEFGYAPVLAVSRSGPDGRTRRIWEIGRRRGVLRIESPEGRAWDFDDAGRLIRREHRDRWRQFTLDQRSWGQMVRGGGATRRLVPLEPEADASPQIRRAHAVARALRQALRRGRRTVTVCRGECEDPRGEADRWLQAAAGWDAPSLAADRARLRSLLLPVPVMPPDLYGALPIQLTEGCSWDRCRFCTLYQGVRYRERSPREVGSTLDALLSHLGASIARFRRLFLGQANALLVDDAILHAHLDEIEARFPRPPRDLDATERRAWIADRTVAVEGFGAFVDAFHRPRRVDAWRALRERGLLRVHIGVESGSETLLQSLGKPVKMSMVERLVADLHRAGVPMGLVFLAGVGGTEREGDHLEATAALLQRLDLREGDQIYLSPLVDPTHDAAMTRFTRLAVRRLRERIRTGLSPAIPVAQYDLPSLAQRSPRG